MEFRKPRALRCSVPSVARTLLRARGFLNTGTVLHWKPFYIPLLMHAAVAVYGSDALREVSYVTDGL